VLPRLGPTANYHRTTSSHCQPVLRARKLVRQERDLSEYHEAYHGAQAGAKKSYSTTSHRQPVSRHRRYLPARRASALGEGGLSEYRKAQLDKEQS
jgi:hypothetical protein